MDVWELYQPIKWIQKNKEKYIYLFKNNSDQSVK